MSLKKSSSDLATLTGLLMWRKTHQSQLLKKVTEKSCDPFQQKWKQAGWALQIHNQYLQSQALVSPWSHFSINCTLSRTARRSSKPPPMLLIWRWIYFYPARPDNTEENQPITNLKPPTFANTTVTGKKVKIAPEDYFFAQFVWCKRIYLTTTKLSIFLSVADFANHAKFVFSWPAWVVYGFAIATKGSKPHSHH